MPPQQQHFVLWPPFQATWCALVAAGSSDTGLSSTRKKGDVSDALLKLLHDDSPPRSGPASGGAAGGLGGSNSLGGASDSGPADDLDIFGSNRYAAWMYRAY